MCVAEDMMIYGTDVISTFGDAPSPAQGLHILPDKAFHDWWIICKGREQIPPGHVIPVLVAMQGHLEAPRLWAKHADHIIRKLGLTLVHHGPCLYFGSYKGARVLLTCQVNDFKIIMAQPRIAGEIFDKVDDYLTFPLKRMGMVTLFNGIGILQTQDYIKISVETYLERIYKRHLET
jgi:hypothetical protein